MRAIAGVDGISKMLENAKNFPYVWAQFALFSFPSMAMALGAPPGFDDFDPVFNQSSAGFPQNLVTFTKQGIL